MRLRTFAMMLAITLFAWPAAAQEQRGSIEGVVKDSSGGVLPGVTVEARSAGSGVVSSVSDANGTYRFPSLLPGLYEVTATLASFKPAKIANVEVKLGSIKTVDFNMQLSSMTEQVTVTAESPMVDVKQSSRQTNIRAEQVSLLPHGRDFTSLVTQAPGANNEAKLGGLSIDGASAGENRYIIDGIETTNLQSGTSGKNLIADFVEEVQVKSSGYTAEYGGAMGGVINVLTKSGTDAFHGNALFNYQGSRLQAKNTPSLRQNLTNSDIAEYVTYPKDDANRTEPGFAVGGPVVSHKAWFFGAYQPAFTTTTRNVSPTSAVNPAANTQAATTKALVQYVTANQTTQFNDKLRSRVAFNNSWSRNKGLLPGLEGTDTAGTNYSKTSAFPNYAISGNADYVASSKLLFGLRGGYYMADQHDSNVTEEPRIIFSTGNNLGIPGVPASLQHGTGFQTIPSNRKVVRDQQTRAYFQADVTSYVKAGGDHQFKVGVQLDRVGNNVLSGESRNLVRLRWNTTLGGERGTYGYYQVRSNGADPKKGFVTEGNIHSNEIGLFAQDAWTINNRLTVNLGLRTERERVPTYTTGADIPEFGLEFSFKNKLAPRAGFSFDVLGDGRTKAFGSWGIFYDIFKLELPRGSFGGDKWLEYYYTLDTFDYTTLVAGSGCPPACSGRLLRGPVDFRHPSFGSDSIQPGLKPMRQQEYTFGVDHQLSNQMALGAHYVRKQLDRAIDDTGSLDAQGNEIYIIANPGEGLTSLAFTNPNVALPKAKRTYDGVELSFQKNLSNRWFLRSSYLWSRLYGNYSGLSQSDENGRTSPNVGRAFDYPLMQFQDGGKAAFGRLATDRPSQFKTQFIYLLPMGTSLGLNQSVASGLPVTREIAIFPPNNYPVQYLGRLSDGRTPVFSQTDLFLQHEFKIAGSRRMQASINLLNLFNQKTSIGKFSTYQKTNGVTPDEALFYAGRQNLADLIVSQSVVKDPRFLMDSAFQAPLVARLGLKFIF